MIEAWVFVPLALLWAVAIAAVAYLPSRDRLVRRRLRERVIVTMRNGDAFVGVLYEADGRTFVLREAKAVADSMDRPVPVDGEIVLDRASIDYFQRPGGDSWRS